MEARRQIHQRKARRARLKRLTAATALAASLEAGLIGFLVFSGDYTPPPAPQVVVLQLPRPTAPDLELPPLETSEPRPAARTDIQPRPVETPPPVIPPAPLPPAPPQPTPDNGSPVAAEIAVPDRGGDLILGCSGLDWDSLTPSQRERCEQEWARIPDIFDRGGYSPDSTIAPDRLAEFEREAAAKAARNAPVYPAGNRGTIGCPEGTMTACADGMMIEMIGKSF